MKIFVSVGILLALAACGDDAVNAFAARPSEKDIPPEIRADDVTRDRTYIPARSEIRPAQVAGGFYPSDPGVLRAEVAKYVALAEKVSDVGRVKCLLVPHAGYVYSGKTAGAAYAQIKDAGFTRVVILAFNHRGFENEIAVARHGYFATPLGNVPVDTELADRIVAWSPATVLSTGDLLRQEHSVEVQLPFLREVVGERLRIVPIHVNTPDRAKLAELAEAIGNLASDPETLIVVSADLAHFPSHDVAWKSDTEILEAIASLDPDTFVAANRQILGGKHGKIDCAICGVNPMLALLLAGKFLNLTHARVIDRTDSFVTGGGDRGRVVGYGAAAFYQNASVMQGRDFALSERSRIELLQRARMALTAAAGRREIELAYDNPELEAARGMFVTLKTTGNDLRGCLGCFESQVPLGRLVLEQTRASALDDRRFAPVRPDEVGNLKIEISILTDRARCENPRAEIVPGIHGVVVRYGERGGTYLPSVWEHFKNDWNEFMSDLCARKAGTGLADAWSRPGAVVERYAALVFSEEEFGLPEKKRTGGSDAVR